MKQEPVWYGDRKVFTVASFNAGMADWVGRLPELWVEGEVTQLARRPDRPLVFFALKDPQQGAAVDVVVDRDVLDRLAQGLGEGEQVHVRGRAEVYRRRGSLRFRAAAIERFGIGEVLARLEALRRKLASEGLLAPERKRPLPAFPRLIGLVTGSDAAAKHDVLTTITTRFPPARVVVRETYVQGPRAPAAIALALEEVCAAGADVIVLARGGGSFDDLLPFSDERLLRAVASCPVPVVSAIGHEQDTPLCDLVADARASTPTAAARLVVPDAAELLRELASLEARTRAAGRRRLERGRADLRADRLRLVRAPALLLERKRTGLESAHRRLRQAPERLLERRRSSLETLAGRLTALSPAATLERGYAIVLREGAAVRSSAAVRSGDRVDVRLAEGGFGAAVEDVRP